MSGEAFLLVLGRANLVLRGVCGGWFWMRTLGRAKYDKSSSRLDFREGLDFWSCEDEGDAAA